MAQVASAALAAVVERTFSARTRRRRQADEALQHARHDHLFRVRHGAAVEAERRNSGLRSRPSTQTADRHGAPRRGSGWAITGRYYPGGYAEYKRSSRRGLTNKLGASGNSPGPRAIGPTCASVAILRTSRFAAIIGIKARRRSTVTPPTRPRPWFAHSPEDLRDLDETVTSPSENAMTRSAAVGLADVAAGLAGILHALVPTTAPGLPYTQHPDDAPEPWRTSPRLARACSRSCGPVGHGAAVHCVCAAGVPAQDFEVRVTYARATGRPNWRCARDGRGRVCLVRRSLPVAAWDGFATDLHISTTTDAEPIGSESGQLSALVLILRGTAEWEA